MRIVLITAAILLAGCSFTEKAPGLSPEKPEVQVDFFFKLSGDRLCLLINNVSSGRLQFEIIDMTATPVVEIGKWVWEKDEETQDHTLIEGDAVLLEQLRPSCKDDGFSI